MIANMESAVLTPLTPWEKKLMRALVESPDGLDCIAPMLSYRHTSIKHAVSRIYRKLGVRGRIALFLFALKHGIIGAPRIGEFEDTAELDAWLTQNISAEHFAASRPI